MPFPPRPNSNIPPSSPYPRYHPSYSFTPTDPQNSRCCAAAFYFLSRNTQLRADLVHVGATAIIAQVALNTKSPRVALSCAASLCNLSLEPGVEARLAEEGAVGALCTLMLTFPQREVWSICLQALYNLTCVHEVGGWVGR